MPGNNSSKQTRNNTFLRSIIPTPFENKCAFKPCEENGIHPARGMGMYWNRGFRSKFHVPKFDIGNVDDLDSNSFLDVVKQNLPKRVEVLIHRKLLPC